MLGKIDIRDIVRDHFRTMVDYGTGRRSIADILLFLVLPATAALACDRVGITIDGNAVNVLITAVSILAGLLFNVLVLIHTVATRFTAPTGPKDGTRFLSEIYSNIAYAILLCLVTLIPLAFLAMSSTTWLIRLLNGISAFLLIHLLLTLLMILKRLHALLRLEIGGSHRSEGSA
jgi:hypothetical protein